MHHGYHGSWFVRRSRYNVPISEMTSYSSSFTARLQPDTITTPPAIHTFMTINYKTMPYDTWMLLLLFVIELFLPFHPPVVRLIINVINFKRKNSLALESSTVHLQCLHRHAIRQFCFRWRQILHCNRPSCSNVFL